MTQDVALRCVASVRSQYRVGNGSLYVAMESDSETDELELLLLCAMRSRKRKRSMWVCPIFTRRRQQGAFHNLLQEMHLTDPESHFRYIRMSKATFDTLLSKVLD